MRLRSLALVVGASLAIAAPALSQDGLRLPSRPAGSGLDTSFAPAWFGSVSERAGFAPNHWRDAIGFAAAAKLRWSYPVGHYSLGMSLASGRDYEAAPIFGAETRQYGLHGRYWLSHEWSVDAETVSREPGSVLRLQDFRIGLRRAF